MSRNWYLLVGMIVTAAFCDSGLAQVTLPLQRNGTTTAVPLHNPTVAAPTTFSFVQSNDDFSSMSNPQSSVINETYSTAGSNATANAFGGISSHTAQGTASCMTAIGASAYSAQVDTLVSGSGDETLGGDAVLVGGSWDTGAIVQTAFDVLPHPDYPQVTQATLRGSFLMFAHENDPVQMGLRAGATLQARIGNSTVVAQYLGPWSGWSVTYNIQQSSVANQTAQPYATTSFVAAYDEEVLCSEYLGTIPTLAVPLQASIWEGDPPALQPGENPPATGRVGAGEQGPCTYQWDLKASGEFHVEG